MISIAVFQVLMLILVLKSGGQIPYQSAAGTTAMLANGTAGQVLQSNGTTTLTYVAANNGSYVLVAGDRIQIDYYY